MGKHDDRQRALKLAKSYLTRDNPGGDEPLDDAQSKVTDLMMDLAAKGVNVSSLTETTWVDLLEGMALDADQTALIFEDIAQWGITDVPDEVL